MLSAIETYVPASPNHGRFLSLTAEDAGWPHGHSAETPPFDIPQYPPEKFI